ncbi:MAG: autotransporter-associated beta strand repeat-containing protein, partial [Puniceicoccales bacterium]|jgi:autotransporter-associated beta strand protein|nr:autotransporter-associated beta strand repeat-containing protein [Puniceicoccales bacterium]
MFGRDTTITAEEGSTILVSASHGLGGYLRRSPTVVLNKGTLTLNSEQYLRYITLNGGTINGTSEIRVDNDTATFTVEGTTASTISAKINNVHNAIWNVKDDANRNAANNNGVDLTISGAISNSGSITKNGAGTMVLTGNNTYSGGTIINGGRLSWGAGSSSSANALGTGAITVNSGAILKIWVNTSSTATTLANNINVNGGTVYSEDGNYNMTGSIVVGAAGATFGAKWNNKNLGLNGVISGTGDIIIRRDVNTYSGSGGEGNATVIFGGNNTYSGKTTVQSGVLQIGNGGTTGTLGSGAVVNNSQLHFNRTNTNQVGNVISGSGSLTQKGTGTTQLTARNTYAGNTNITGGTLDLSGTGGIYTGATKTGTNSIAISGGGVLVGDRWGWNADQSLGMLNFNAGNISVNNGTIRNVAASDVYMGGDTGSRGIAVGSGGMTLENATANTKWTWAAGSAASTFADNANLTLTGAGNGAFAQNVTGTGVSVTKAGAGTWTLSGTGNTYTGTTTINAGTLLINGDQSAATGAITVNNGGTLGGSGTIGGAVTIKSGGILSPGNSPGTINFANNVTLESGARLVLEIDGTGTGQHDVLNFTGTNKTLTFVDGSELYVAIGAGVGIGDIDGLSIATGGATIAGWNDVLITSNHSDWTITISDSGVLTAVPEPSTYALIGAALAIGLVAIRHRRKN